MRQSILHIPCRRFSLQSEEIQRAYVCFESTQAVCSARAIAPKRDADIVTLRRPYGYQVVSCSRIFTGGHGRYVYVSASYVLKGDRAVEAVAWVSWRFAVPPNHSGGIRNNTWHEYAAPHNSRAHTDGGVLQTSYFPESPNL